MMTESQGKQPLISVIVPVYNVAEYLQECVDSIINQTYKNLEIILVDDGSTDACPDICDEYAKRDSRIRVIHKKNGGLSDARNAGLDICTGEWIGFVDSDDYIAHDMYEKLYYGAIVNSSDVAVCHFYCRDNGSSFNSSNFSRKEIYTTKQDMICQMFSGGGGTLSTCLKLYERKIFSNLRFPKGINYEDAYIVLDVIKLTTCMVVLPDMLYFYRNRKGSITKTCYWNAKMWDGIFVYKHILDLLSKEYPTLKNEGIRRLNWVYRANIKCAIATVDMKDHLDEIEQVCREFKDFFYKYDNNSSISLRGKIDSLILILLPISVYSFLCKILNTITDGCKKI